MNSIQYMYIYSAVCEQLQSDADSLAFHIAGLIDRNIIAKDNIKNILLCHIDLASF